MKIEAGRRVPKIFCRVLVYTISLFLIMAVNQSVRYAKLETEVRRLYVEQDRWVESNKRLIESINVLLSPERIGNIARNSGMKKKRPEDIWMIVVENDRSRAK